MKTFKMTIGLVILVLFGPVLYVVEKILKILCYAHRVISACMFATCDTLVTNRNWVEVYRQELKYGGKI